MPQDKLSKKKILNSQNYISQIRKKNTHRVARNSLLTKNTQSRQDYLNYKNTHRKISASNIKYITMLILNCVEKIISVQVTILILKILNVFDIMTPKVEKNILC